MTQGLFFNSLVIGLLLLSVYFNIKNGQLSHTNETSNGLIPIQIQATLLSVSLSAFISWFITSRRNKTELAFDLHREFNTKESYEARQKGEQFLINQPNITLEELYKKVPFQIKLEDFQNIFLVIRFYERLWIAIENNEIKTQLIPQLFGEKFYW